MKILLIGATGTIGSAVAVALETSHQVLPVGHSNGELRADLADKGSLEALYEKVGSVDAVVCTAGNARLGLLGELTDEDIAFSLRHKLMGQVNLVRRGLPRLNEGGSFTLTSGVLAVRPIPGSTAASLTNAAIEGFARAAALEAPGGIRINVVSPPWISETLRAMGRSPAAGLPAADAARAYVEAVEGTLNGQVLRPE